MKQKNNALRLAIAACFGVAAGQAGAVVTLGTPVPYALENPNNASLQSTTSLLAIALSSIPALKPTTTTPFYTKVNLLNGAVFDTAPNLLCAASGLGGTAGITFTGTIDLGGTIGSNSVTFRVTALNGAGDSAYLTTGCTVSAASYTVSGLTTKSVSAVLEYTNGASIAATAQVGSWITFQRGLSTTVSAPAVDVVVDATSGSDNFVVGSNLGLGTAYLGFIKYAANGVTAFDSAGANMEPSVAMTSASLTVSGPAIAAAIAFGNSGVFLSTVSACSDSTNAATFSTSAGTSVTFNNVAATVLSGGTFICARVPQNVTITTGQLTATLSNAVATATTRTLDVSATSNNIANVTANGSTRNAYFVNASTSTNKTSVLRIINKAGISGALTATAYNEAGTVIGTANSSLGTVANNQMLSKTSAELETALGITGLAPTAKYSVVISGALGSFEVLNFTKDNATGSLALSNTSTTTNQ